MRAIIEAEPLAKIDYVSMVDALDMQPVESVEKMFWSLWQSISENQTDRQLQLRGIRDGTLNEKSRESQFFPYKTYWNYHYLFLCDRIFSGVTDSHGQPNIPPPFLGVAMFGMGLTIKIEDFKRVFSRPKEIVIGFVAQYTIMPVVAWGLCRLMQLPTDLALGVILVGCCPGGTASNVITYIAGGDVALSVGMTITSTLCSSTDDTITRVSACRCLGRSIFPRNGNFRREGCTGSCSTWYSDQLLLRKADPEKYQKYSL